MRLSADGDRPRANDDVAEARGVEVSCVVVKSVRREWMWFDTRGEDPTEPAMVEMEDASETGCAEAAGGFGRVVGHHHTGPSSEGFKKRRSSP